MKGIKNYKDKLFAVGTSTREGTIWLTIKTETKRSAKQIGKQYGQVFRVKEIKEA